jgi:hypothetical protein
LTQHDIVERRVISLLHRLSGRQEERKSTRCSPSPELVTAFTSEPFLRAHPEVTCRKFSAHMASAPSYSPPIAPGVVLQLMLPSLLPSASPMAERRR